MYNEYAADPRMRLNLGIRRRLAPLMENDRRKVELLNSLLFTLPGSPVLYYGDELGMGDNIWLGDRDGVRTPMQWSPDRNAGFSHAEAARLYLPVIVDSVYGYQAINVEAQERSPFSLLNWTKRLIQVRKRHPALGRGSIEFPRPENPHVLAHLREHDGNTILVVHNLSASAQPVQLDLARFAGVKPVELLGDTEFPPVGESPYTLTLGPYGFFWFGLPVPEPARTEVAARPGEPGDGEMERLAALVGEVSSEWLREQRWFRGKGKSSVRLRLADALRLPGEGGEGSVYLVLADAEHREGEPERYLLVAAVSAGPETEPSVSSVLLGESELHLWEVAEESDPAAAILTLLRSGSELAGREGRFTFALPSPAAVPAPAAEVRPLGREQSNTSLFVGPDRVLKLYRHIEPGVNPDLELARYLSVDADFPNVPALFGWVEYEDAGGERWSLAALSEFVPNQGDGWTLALERLRGTLTEPAGESGFGEDLIRLGEVTGRLHLALAGLGSAGVTEEDVREWAGVMIREQEWVLDELAVRLKSMPGAFSPELQAGIATLLRGRGELHAVTNGLARLATVSQKIRGHGDYHLGQVLRTAPEPEVPGGWMVLDFEGEVARPLAERREPHSPLRDVAGMLRSLDYAVRTVARERVDTPSWDPAAAAAWLRQAREEFLDGYFGTVKGSGLVPDPPEAWRPALVALELEKAVYEMRYEMDNRPEWLGIPVAGVVGLIGSEA